MQTVLRYNTPQVTANKELSLRARAVTNTNRLEVCLAYTGARPNTGIVLVDLVEVELLRATVRPKRLNSEHNIGHPAFRQLARRTVGGF